jgi:hypothetical protein
MPLSPNFSTSQTSGAPESINFIDTSTGSDVAVVTRRIYMQKSDGTFLVETGTSTEYEVWSGFPGTTTITLDVLEQAEGLTITVQWLDVSNAVLYDKALVYGFPLFLEEFDYGLTQLMAANPLLINDNNFFNNKSLLRTLLDSGNQAIEQASDTYNAQLCYDQGTELMTSSQYYFNGNS